jgi:hypothetical protein
MPHDLVQTRRPERLRLNAAATPVIECLAQSEQLEVIDQTCRHEEKHPPECRQRYQRDARDLPIDRPHDALDRLPLPDHERDGESGGKYIGAALDGLRHEAGPPPLEATARHYAMLDSEEAEQEHVDQRGRRDGARGPAVDGLQSGHVCDETHRVDERGQEKNVYDTTVDEKRKTGHGDLRSMNHRVASADRCWA